MIWYHRLHEYTRVYIHSKLHIQLGARRNKFKLKRKWLYVKQWAFWMELFCLNVWWYICYRKISKIWHTQFSIQNVTSFSFCWKYSGWRWIFKEYSRCDFFTHCTHENVFKPNSLKCFWTFCNKISLLWFMEQKL